MVRTTSRNLRASIFPKFPGGRGVCPRGPAKACPPVPMPAPAASPSNLKILYVNPWLACPTKALITGQKCGWGGVNRDIPKCRRGKVCMVSIYSISAFQKCKGTKVYMEGRGGGETRALPLHYPLNFSN